MSNKSPINNLKLLQEVASPYDKAIKFSRKTLKKLLKSGYKIDLFVEYFYDGEEGLEHLTWIDENYEGVWGMTQKDVDNMVIATVRRFSHFTRRSRQKVFYRCFVKEHKNGTGTISFYLYMRDIDYCDYVIYLSRDSDWE